MQRRLNPLEKIHKQELALGIKQDNMTWVTEAVVKVGRCRELRHVNWDSGSAKILELKWRWGGVIVVRLATTIWFCSVVL